MPPAESIDLWNALGIVLFDVDMAAASLAFGHAVDLSRQMGLTRKGLFTTLNHAVTLCLLDRPAEAERALASSMADYPKLEAFRNLLITLCAMSAGRTREATLGLLVVDWGGAAGALRHPSSLVRGAFEALVRSERWLPLARAGDEAAQAQLTDAQRQRRGPPLSRSWTPSLAGSRPACRDAEDVLDREELPQPGAAGGREVAISRPPTG